MTTPTTLLFSDLDGTLLNHKDYSLGGAIEKIAALSEQGIPVVLVTSKTLAEVVQWRKRLGLDTPFAAENGGAVYFPKGAFHPSLFEGNDLDQTGEFIQVQLGTSLTEIRRCMSPIIANVPNLVDCSLKEAMSMTSLNQAEAVLAQNRSWTLPLFTKDPELIAALRNHSASMGLVSLQGGRFLHIQGQVDKGDAMRLIADTYRRRDATTYRTLAIGDSENDRSMLEHADIAVVVAQTHTLILDRKDAIYTHHRAPQGWVEGIEIGMQHL